MNPLDNTETVLACSHGYKVKTVECYLGTVETPIFAGTSLQPDSLLVRPYGLSPTASKIVPVASVIDVNSARQEITVDTNAGSILTADTM